MRRRLAELLSLVVVLIMLVAGPAFGGVNPNCTFNPDGSIEQCAGGSGGPGGGGGGTQHGDLSSGSISQGGGGTNEGGGGHGGGVHITVDNFSDGSQTSTASGGSGGGGDSIGIGSGGQCTFVYDAATNSSTEECTPGVLGY